LIAAVETPLGPIAGDVRLRDIRREDRLDELSFELPVAGGEAPTGAVHTSDLAEMFARHTDPAGPLRGYADKLAAPVLQSELRGYLTGSLDLVFRTRPTDDSTYKYFVADYKTNRLAPAAEQLTVRQYRPEALDAEMQRAHYPLQAVLYTVALHRYLRWRMPGYKPEVNLGGVLYLFLRGMTGADCPVVDGTRCGVFAWVPPTSLVIGLSDLFDRGRSAG